jgi:hypothetical protein
MRSQSLSPEITLVLVREHINLPPTPPLTLRTSIDLCVRWHQAAMERRTSLDYLINRALIKY